MSLPARYQKALQTFVAKRKKDPRVIGILLCGTITFSKPDKNSDLDVQVVLDKATARTRGNTWINGVEVEYLVNPVSQIRQYFKDEEGKHTAHMFAHSVILYKKGTVIDVLVKEAKKKMSEPLPKMSAVQKELARYSLDDLSKDLEDVYVKKDWFALERLVHETTDKCVTAFLLYHRNVPEKAKRLANYLENTDPTFAKLVVEVTVQHEYKKKFNSVKKLVSYTENLIGGKRPKEWELTGPLTFK